MSVEWDDETAASTGRQNPSLMPPAQHIYKTMQRTRVAPALRDMGLKGSGRQFQIPSDSHWALLGFQASAWSDAQRLAFTVNMTVVSRADWAEIHCVYPQLGTRPQANSGIAPIFSRVAETGYWHSRIGMLMPGCHDTWWEIAADEDSTRVAQEVIAAIHAYGLPAMHARVADA